MFLLSFVVIVVYSHFCVICISIIVVFGYYFGDMFLLCFKELL